MGKKTYQNILYFDIFVLCFITNLKLSISSRHTYIARTGGNVGPIVVGSLVGLLVLIVFAGVVFYLFRRKFSEKCIS